MLNRSHPQIQTNKHTHQTNKPKPQPQKNIDKTNNKQPQKANTNHKR